MQQSIASLARNYSAFRFFILSLAGLTWASIALAQRPTTLLVDVDHRPSVSLNGPWHYIADPYRQGWGDDPAKPNLTRGYAKNRHWSGGSELLEYDFARSPTLEVPGDWNSERPDLFFYEGMLWYEKDFDWHPKPNSRTFLHFGAANLSSHVFVNGNYSCQHQGGFTPFDCEITSDVKDGANFVVVAVDDERHADTIPALKTDWFNYGGLTREVYLVEVPETYIDDYSLQLRRGTKDQLDGYVHVEGAAAGTSIELSIPDLKVRQSAKTGADGRAAFSFTAPGLKLWSPEHPQLYRVEMKAGSDALNDDIGFRTIEVQGDQILLNGQPVFLRGVCIHAEAPIRSGRAWSEQDAETLLGWAHDLNANFVRLAHYPHDEHMTRMADKIGIMVWSEVPVYWAIDWKNPATLAAAKQQLGEMIRRDHNKASVILWSVSNETPRTPERLVFLKEMIAQAREQDPTRLITSAMLTPMEGMTATLSDPLGEFLDVLGSNEYIGWYTGKPEDAPKYTWKDPYGKPLIMSEFGGGAKAGMHGGINDRFTEEYQENLYQQQLAMLRQIPFLRGMTAWVLMDFRSPVRQLPGIQDMYNRKGLVSNEGARKKAFGVLREFYANPPQ